MGHPEHQPGRNQQARKDDRSEADEPRIDSQGRTEDDRGNDDGPDNHDVILSDVE